MSSANSTAFARLRVACVSLIMLVYLSAPCAILSLSGGRLATENPICTSACTGLSNMSYFFSAIDMDVIVTGSTREGPQMKRMRGTCSRGTGRVGGLALLLEDNADPIASIAAP